jgi:hypothetical protein
MAVDWDTFVMNNADTKKEAVDRTYRCVDGFTPQRHLSGSLLLPEWSLRPVAAFGAGD